MTIGRELKLVFADQSLAKAVFDLLAVPQNIGGYAFLPKKQQEVRDIYFDTATRSLQRQGVSLRLRWCDEVGPMLEFKRPEGDVATEMRYGVIAGPHFWDETSNEISPSGDPLLELQSLGVAERLPRIGSIATTRNTLIVTKAGRISAEICLDRFCVVRQGEDRALKSAEVEIKGTDPRELQFLGESLANWFGMVRVTSSKLDRHIPVQQPAARLLLDMDPGVDDSLALLYLLCHSQRPPIDAITVVGGNVSVNQCARNAYRICRWAQERGLVSEIPPIGLGVDLSSARSSASNVHGTDGMGDVDWVGIDDGFGDFPLRDASELQREVLLANTGTITVLATGPCSNLALLIEKHPDALGLAREVIVMGGVFFDCGNRGPQSEFNIHSDSRAARRLVEFCRQSRISNGQRFSLPLTFVGLDVTHRAILERQMISSLPGEIGHLATAISSKYMDFYHRVLGVDGCPLHDPLAMAIALHPEFAVRQAYHVEVISTPDAPEVDGITIADHRPCGLFKDRGKQVTQVAVSVNSDAFLSDFLGRMNQAL